MRLASLLAASSSLLATGGMAVPTAPIAGKPTYGSYGFDTAGMDRGVAPGDDFADYANGGWKRTTAIPADRASYGMFNKLQDLSLDRTRTILDAARARPGDKPGAFYASFMDEKAADAKGIAPIRPWLDRIAAAQDKAALAGVMAAMARINVDGLFHKFEPFDAQVRPDDKDPTHYIFTIHQAGLGLPDRDYYLKSDPKLVDARTAYLAYLIKLYTLAGQPDAAAKAKAVYGFEAKLAGAHWSRIDSRDADKTYNKWSPADFAANAPGFDWSAYFDGLGIGAQPAMLVAQPSGFAGEAKAWADAPLPLLKDYLAVRLIDGYAPYLSKPFVDTRFAFRGTVLSGQPENQPRWKRGVTLVSLQMGESVGRDYVARYFPPESKAAADQLVRNVIAAYGERLKVVPWMAPATRTEALRKLAAFKPMIGYPAEWRDYSALKVQPDDLVGNVMRGNQFEFARNLAKLGRPVDRGEWGMTPMTINAYADPVMNVIVFPAAILQPPFFDAKADPAVNYGGIGAVIGHELSHHFDDQGRKYDPTGKLADWWTPQDVTRFTALTDKLVKQYDAYEPLPGQHVQGALTLGENMADVAGLTVAHAAYLKSLGGKPAPTIAGTSGDQRFFLGWAQVWRTKYREPALRQQLLTDPHSPGDQRVDEVRNQDAWYDAFGIKPGAKLYLAPDRRVKVW